MLAKLLLQYVFGNNKQTLNNQPVKVNVSLFNVKNNENALIFSNSFWFLSRIWERVLLPKFKLIIIDSISDKYF